MFSKCLNCEWKSSVWSGSIYHCWLGGTAYIHLQWKYYQHTDVYAFYWRKYMLMFQNATLFSQYWEGRCNACHAAALLQIHNNTSVADALIPGVVWLLAKWYWLYETEMFLWCFRMDANNLLWHWKSQSRQYANVVPTGGTGGCRNDNPRCHQ